MCEAKGFIEDEQQWLITGSLHIPAEFTSEEDREKFDSQPKSPPGMKEPDGVKPSIFYKSEMGAGDCHNHDKNGHHYLGKMDVVQRSKGILQILMGRSCLTLEVSVVVKGM